ncbi:unnamed protein product, partial [Musa banksii]
ESGRSHRSPLPAAGVLRSLAIDHDSLDLGDIVRDCPSARCTTRLSCLYHEAVVAGDC